MLPPWLLSGWLYDGGATGARTLLGAVASSTIAVAGTVFSITIAAFSLAAGQMGPRLLRNFIRDRGNQVTLGALARWESPRDLGGRARCRYLLLDRRGRLCPSRSARRADKPARRGADLAIRDANRAGEPAHQFVRPTLRGSPARWKSLLERCHRVSMTRIPPSACSIDSAQ